MIGSIIIIIFLSQNTSIQNQETIIHHNYHTIPSSSSMKQQLLTSLALLAFLLTPSATAFVEPKSTAHSRKHSMPPLHSWLTNPHRSFLRRQPSSYDERRRIRQEISNLEDEDFLLADLKPKLLVHERDFFRQDIRMSAWDEYVLVSILCTSISYNALTSFTLNPDHVGIIFYENFLRNAIHLVAGIAVLCGLYSTMVFSLSILYGKTALGLERDGEYDAFFQKTAEIRDRAFLAFSLALVFFAILVVLVLSEDLPLVMNFPLGSLLVVVLFAGYQDWKTMVTSGQEIIDFLDD